LKVQKEWLKEIASSGFAIDALTPFGHCSRTVGRCAYEAAPKRRNAGASGRRTAISYSMPRDGEDLRAHPFQPV